MSTVPNPVCPVCEIAPHHVDLMVRAVVAFRADRRGWGGATFRRVPVCQECYRKAHRSPESPDGLARLLSPMKYFPPVEIECIVCALPVEVEDDPRRTVDVCSDACRSKFYKSKKPVPRPVTCDACGTSFTGRADARFCSSACRQKAYRDRQQGAPLT